MAAAVATVSVDVTDTDPPIVESAFFVPRAEIDLGSVPAAEPVVLVDEAQAHQYVGVRFLQLVDPPKEYRHPARLAYGSTPLFEVDWHEAALFENVRPALVVRDARTSMHR
jgi:hypothetical protein